MSEQVFLWSDYKMMLPEMFLAVSCVALLLLGAFNGKIKTSFINYLTVFIFIITGLLAFFVSWGDMGEEPLTSPMNMYVTDNFTVFMKILVLGSLSVSLLLSVKYLYEEQLNRFEFPVLVSFAGLGMFIMISAGNFISLYLGMELQALCFYVLATFHRDKLRSAEAGLKYFVLGSVASCMILFGISFMYGVTGSVDYLAVKEYIEATSAEGITTDGGYLPLMVAMVFIMIGFAFKLSAVPFHIWTPDVYQGSPTPVTCIFSLAPKIAAFSAFITFLIAVMGDAHQQWSQIIYFLSVASMVVGAFAALPQNDIKRLMAYSTIGHVGYAMVGLVSGAEAGISSVIVYVIVYIVMVAGIFAVIHLMRRNGIETSEIDDLSGLVKTNPFVAYSLSILLFSMGGIPPFAGFFAKLMVFESALNAGYLYLVIVGVLTSVIAAYYYLRIIKKMMFDEPAEPVLDGFLNIEYSVKAVLLLSVIFVTGFTVFPEVVISSVKYAVGSLFVLF